MLKKVLKKEEFFENLEFKYDETEFDLAEFESYFSQIDLRTH